MAEFLITGWGDLALTLDEGSHDSLCPSFSRHEKLTTSAWSAFGKQTQLSSGRWHLCDLEDSSVHQKRMERSLNLTLSHILEDMFSVFQHLV